MSKIILKELGHVSYPIGVNMEELLVTVKNMADAIKELYPLHENIKNGFNFFVRGSSGAIISGLICSYLSNYPTTICHIKKENESSHCGSKFLSYHSKAVNIIIDDFISSGETVNKIYEKVIGTTRITNIDLLIVSGDIFEGQLKFKPLHIICEKYILNDNSTEESLLIKSIQQESLEKCDNERLNF